MVKLALAVEDESALGYDTAVLPVEARAGEALFRGRRDMVLVYRVAESFVMFLGRGRVAALEFSNDGAPSRCRIAPFARFDAPVVSQAEARIPGVRRWLRLEDERYDEIVTQGTDIEAVRLAAEEMNAPFEAAGRKIEEVYLRIYAEVLRRWNHRCAITGAAFAPSEGLHPSLQVVAIRPREAGGPLHVLNYLPMLGPLAQAWSAGHLTLGPDLSFWIDKHRFDPELEARLLPIGRLLDVSDGEAPPDELQLAYHRRQVFGRA